MILALLSFVAAAAILTITPGLDTVLVIRTRLAAGRTAAIQTAAGIACGCFIWGIAVALGLGAMLAAAPLVYEGLRWCGAAYLLASGAGLLLSPRSRLDVDAAGEALPGHRLFVTGLLTNLLNPKIGLFYLSFLPQFVPDSVPAAPFMVGLTAIHAAMGLAWLSAMAASLGPMRRLVLRPSALRWLDRAAGGVFIGFGLRLAFDRA